MMIPVKKQAFITLTFFITTLASVAAPAFAATQQYTSQGIVCAGTTSTVVETVSSNGKVTYYNNTFPNGFTAPTTPTVWTVKVNNISFKSTFLAEKPGQLWLSIPTVTRILNIFGDHATFNGKTISATSPLRKLINFAVGNPGTYPNAMVNGRYAMYGMATKKYDGQTFINLYSAAQPINNDCDIFTTFNTSNKTFVAYIQKSNHYTGFYTSTGQPILSN